MSDVFFEEMKIPQPKYFLGIGGKTHGAMTGQMIEKIEEVALKEKTDWIMVYGDTNSTLAGAIVASKLHIKLAHVEAGLRSFNMQMPEEVNRILTDRVSNLLLCPTEQAMANLKNEGYENINCKFVNVGDVMKDGTEFYKQYAVKPQIDLMDNDFVLCTIHRAENTDNIARLRSIFFALTKIAEEQQVVLPLHPRTQKIVEQNNIDTINLTIVEPVGYLQMVWLISNCTMVMTDSGGLQKEAYFFKKPCITMRDETEWVELIDSGMNILVGANEESIINAYKSALTQFNFETKLYGKNAAQNIIMEILNYE